MKNISISLQDTILQALLLEQIQMQKLWTIDETKPDLIISDKIQVQAIPHLILGIKISALPEGCKTIMLPCRLGEIVDQIKYMLSRRQRFAGADQDFSIGPYILEPGIGQITHNNMQTSVRLTDKEKLILISLSNAKDGKLDRKTLLELVWGYAESAETHTLETHLYRLRQKLEEYFNDKNFIITENGFYFLNLNS